MRARWPNWRWLILGLVCLSSPAWAQQTKLENVRMAASGDRTRVVFDLSGPVNPDLFMLRDPARLVVDIPDTKKVGPHPGTWSGVGVVEQLRTGIRHGRDLRIVLDLATVDVRPDSFTLASSNGKHGHRLVVDLYAQSERPGTAPQVASAEHTTPATGTAQNDAREIVAESSQSNADTASQPVAYTPVAPTHQIVVAVDAGHGGHDPGAIGPHGTKEKNVVLSMARKLAAMIDEQPNMRAILTRKRDNYVGLRERSAIARKADADLFVSIHANSSVDQDPHGVAVFALSLGGATSEHARLLAERENAALNIGGVSLENKNTKVASFMLDLAQSATIEASLDVANRVLNNLNRFTSLHKSDVEQAAFVVLKSPDTPSILVETGFISNPKEERELRSDTYQTRVVRAILQGVKGYFASYRPATMIAKGQVHTVESGETLSGIAASYHVSLSRLREVNGIDGNLILVGQELNIPPPGLKQVASLR